MMGEISFFQSAIALNFEQIHPNQALRSNHLAVYSVDCKVWIVDTPWNRNMIIFGLWTPASVQFNGVTCYLGYSVRSPENARYPSNLIADDSSQQPKFIQTLFWFMSEKQFMQSHVRNNETALESRLRMPITYSIQICILKLGIV